MKVRMYLATAATVWLATGLISAKAATWGSIRGNNRDGETHGGFRGGVISAPRQAAPAPRSEARTPARIEPRGGEARGERGFVRGEREERFEHARPEREWREHRDLDIDEDRHHSFFWFGFHPGMVIGTLPPDYSQVYVGGNPYYYDQGVYYQPGPSGYIVVTPPLGALVPQLPPGAEALPVGPTVYYYAAGAFYVQVPQGFQVVAPPLGITVTELPPGAVPVTVNGIVLYQADGAYFQPMIQNGVTVYMTVNP